MVFAAPLLLIVGALVALVPVALHLIAPRPPARAPLPTARFLEPDARMRVRMARTPDEPLLLLLRVLLLLLIFVALAGPRLTHTRDGTTDIVLLDAASPQLADSARALARGGTLIIVDSAARESTGAVDVASSSSADFAVAFRALLDAGRRSGTDSVRAWLLSAPRWAAWSPGTALFRAGWPGSIGLVLADASVLPDESLPALRVQVVDSSNGVLTAALRAAGFATATRSDTSVDVIFGEPTDTRTARITVVSMEEAAALRAESGLVLDDGTVLENAVGGRIALPPRARIIAVWRSGAPAVAAVDDNGGCLVVHGFALTQPHPSLPAAVARLARGCDRPVDPAAALPLDAGARAFLAQGTQAEAVHIAALPGPRDGRGFGRILLIAALIVAVLETLVARGRRGTAPNPAGTPDA